MESPMKTSFPAVLSPKPSYPFTHGSAISGSQRTPSFPPTADEPVAATSSTDRSRSNHIANHNIINNNLNPFHTIDVNHQHHDPRANPHAVADTHRQKRQNRHLVIDTTSSDRSKLKPHHKHKHSKPRDSRLPRTMTQIASSAGARGLLPSWSGGKEKTCDGDDGLLRPITQETTRSRWGSDSTSILGWGSRRNSLFIGAEQGDKIGSVRQQEICSMGDLEQVKNRRKQGEEYLRSALSSIGTLATDITRRLDYTYYNLLEKITALNSTISSFQELSDSTSALFDGFEREVTGLDQEIRKQIGELKGFQPQIQKIESLEERMKSGRQRAEMLGNRLEAMRDEIDRWERREEEWQTRIGRRLRIFWGVLATAMLVILLAVIIQSWPTIWSVSNHDVLSQIKTAANQSSDAILNKPEFAEPVPELDGQGDNHLWPRHSSGLADHHTSRRFTSLANTPTSKGRNMKASPTDSDPLRLFDEL